MSPNDAYIELAVKTAMWSPCRSKRGVVIWDEDGIVSWGLNAPPAPFICDGTADCKATCSRTAIHAEQKAILGIARELRNPEMLHVKAVDGKLVPSGPPSCLQCAKLILAAGIKAMWLFHENGWRRYPADDSRDDRNERHAARVGFPIEQFKFSCMRQRSVSEYFDKISPATPARSGKGEESRLELERTLTLLARKPSANEREESL